MTCRLCRQYAEANLCPVCEERMAAPRRSRRSFLFLGLGAAVAAVLPEPVGAWPEVSLGLNFTPYHQSGIIFSGAGKVLRVYRDGLPVGFRQHGTLIEIG